MSKADRIREELGWLKVVLALVVAIDTSLVAWLAQNYQATTGFLVVLGILGVAFLTTVVAWLNRSAMRLLRDLEQQ